MNAGSQDIYYVYDGLGSVSMLTNLVGISLGSYTYDVFGSTRSQMGLVNNNSFLFTGRQLDNETGLYYYRNRFYNPSLGRFITKDPIGLEGGINQYSYVRNNPIVRKDPFGLVSDEELSPDPWNELSGGVLGLFLDPSPFGVAGFLFGMGLDKYKQNHQGGSNISNDNCPIFIPYRPKAFVWEKRNENLIQNKNDVLKLVSKNE